jgi:ubiquinone/menaquinone biosynthesis C-methylase UbiE
MKRADLFHPRIFSDQAWAEGYYQRNVKNIERVGKRFVRLLQHAGFEKGRILDTGCGFGAVAIEIAKSFNEVEIVGIDLGKPLLKLGQSLAEQSGVAERIQFAEGDVQQLDFEPDTFDVVINTFMLHIVDDPVTMLNEIERVTKPSGKIMVTDLRRIWLAIVVKKLKTSYTLTEAKVLINQSDIRAGRYAKGPFWWDYMVGV